MNLISEKFKKHPILIHAEELQGLCKPLEFLNITTFTHLQVDLNNQLSGLSNHPDCWINYVNNNYFDADPLVIIKPETIDIGQYLVWDAVECRGQVAAMVKDAADFNFKHVFTIIKTQSNVTHYYSFGTNKSNQNIYHTYIANIDLLDRFIHFFSRYVDQSKHLLSAYDFIINPEKKISVAENHEANFDFTNQQYNRNIFLNTLSSSIKDTLTTKEIECAKLLIEGKSAKEIALVVKLSFRTIEDKIASLKRKLDAKNKSALIAKLVKYL